MPLRFLIVDGYPEESRREFDVAGMKYASVLYAEMLKAHLPGAEYRYWYPSDTAEPPDGEGPENYTAILWPGCNLTIYHQNDARVTRQIEFARKGYEVGVPAFGTCWGLQMAAVAAGGTVEANPRGREMGLVRTVRVTAEGHNHPMMAGRPAVFSGFTSHLDEVTALPPGGKLLAEGDFTHVQAIEVRHGKGVFWGLAYHPEYDLHEMARLLQARAQKLINEKFFNSAEDLAAYIDSLETLHQHPDRKDLRWRLVIDDDVLAAGIRQNEFNNWIRHAVLAREARA